MPERQAPLDEQDVAQVPWGVPAEELRRWKRGQDDAERYRLQKLRGWIAVGDMSRKQRELLDLSVPGPHDPDETWRFENGRAIRVGTLSPGSTGQGRTKSTGRTQPTRARTVTPTKDASGLGLLNVVDLGEVIKNGVEPPSMLVPDLIVGGGVPHRFSGPQECGKTWCLLDACVQLAKAGRKVIWVDLEMGRILIAERLIALGADAEDISNWLVYLDHGSLDTTPASVTAWEALLDEHKPELVVVDAQMEALASSGLSENYASDVLLWNYRYLEPALIRGCSTVLIDHTGHEAGNRARGSSAKGQASRVELLFKKVASFDRQTIGLVEVTVAKNAIAAEIPKQQTFEIGGYLDSSRKPRFMWSRYQPTLDDLLNGAGSGSAEAMRQKMKKAIAEIGPASMNKLKDMVTGRARAKQDALAWLRESDPEVQVEKVGNSHLFSIRSVPDDRFPPEARGGAFRGTAGFGGEDDYGSYVWLHGQASRPRPPTKHTAPTTAQNVLPVIDEPWIRSVP